MTIPLHQVWAALGGDPAELRRLQVTGPPTTLRSTFAVTAAAAAGGRREPAGRHARHRRAGRPSTPAGSPSPCAASATCAATASRRAARSTRSRRSTAPPTAGCGCTPTTRGTARPRCGCWAARKRDAPAAIAERGRRRAGDGAARGGRGGRRGPHRGGAGGPRPGPPPPLVEHARLGPPPRPRPARRPRVLDLTRVIAGPVATRTLAAHGADVLRLDAPDRPEIPLQSWDTLPGKRSALLDLRGAGRRCERAAGRRGRRRHRLPAGRARPVRARPGSAGRSATRGWWSSRCRPGAPTARGARGAGSTASCRRRAGSPSTKAGRTPPARCRPRCSTTPPATSPPRARSWPLARQRRDGGTPPRAALAGRHRGLAAGPAARRPRGRAGRRPRAVPRGERGRFTLAAPPGTIDAVPLTWPDPAPAYGAATPEWT